MLAEDRAGGRTLVIGDNLCGSRLIALQFMDFFRFAAKPADDGLYTLPCFFVPYFITFEILAKGIYRQVITGGSETAGKDEQVSDGKAIVYGFEDLRDVIADAHLAGELPSMLVKEGCDPGAVCIGNLADHQLVADGQYGCFLKVVHNRKGLNSCKEKGYDP